jgi:hypothetical protein
VKFRCKLIAGDTNRSDLRLGRQRAAFETVDADDGARTSHVLQLLLECRRIVGERIDLIAGERGAKRRTLPVGGRRLFILFDGDRGFNAFDIQHRRLPILPVADPNVGERALLESREDGVDRIAPGDQTGDGGHAAGRGLNRRRLH